MASRSVQRATQQLKMSNYLGTDDAETVDFNNDIDIDYIRTDVNVSSDEIILSSNA